MKHMLQNSMIATLTIAFGMFTQKTHALELDIVDFTLDSKGITQKVDKPVEKRMIRIGSRPLKRTLGTATASTALKSVAPAADAIQSITFMNEVISSDLMAPVLRIRIKSSEATTYDMNKYFQVRGGASLTLNKGADFSPTSGFLLSVAHGNVAETTLLTASNVQTLIAGFGSKIALVKETITSNTWRYTFASR